MAGHVLLTPQSQIGEVCSIEEIRRYLRLQTPPRALLPTPAAQWNEDEGEDQLLRRLLRSATTWFQDLTARQLMPAVWQLTMSAFPGYWAQWTPPNYPLPQVQGVPLGGWPLIGSLNGLVPEALEIPIPYPPVSAIQSIKYTDTTGTVQTLDPSLYQFDNTTWYPRVAPAYGQTWPVAQLQYNSVIVQYQAGYAGADGVPDDIVRAILALVGAYYATRETLADKALVEVPYAAQATVAKYKVTWSY